MNNARLIPVLALAVGLLTFGTGPALALTPPEINEPDPSITDGSARQDFRDARAKWLNAGIHSYRIKVTRSCFCPPPNEIKVRVRRGRTVRISVQDWAGPRSVPGMFREVHRAIERGVPELKVKYHPRFGFVQSVWVDNIKMAADDEIGYGISGFRRLR